MGVKTKGKGGEMDEDDNLITKDQKGNSIPALDTIRDS